MDTNTLEACTTMVKARPFADARLKLAKHSPEILVGAGITGILVSTVLACKATLRAQEVLDEANDKFNDIKEATELVEDYTVEDRRKDMFVASVQTAVAFTKLYGVPVALMGVSIFAVLKGHGITMQRNAGLTSALTAMSTGYKAYRDRVKEAVGADKEEDIYFNRKSETLEFETADGKIAKKKVTTTDFPEGHSVYARFFDDASPAWQPSPEMNLTFLLCQQNYANDKLRINKHLFLNEVYDMLGIPRTSAGAVVGWAITSAGDNFVDFGIHTSQTREGRLFVNGMEESILLDFNVDGVIYNLI
jgi:hypothetical protein